MPRISTNGRSQADAYQPQPGLANEAMRAGYPRTCRTYRFDFQARAHAMADDEEAVATAALGSSLAAAGKAGTIAISATAAPNERIVLRGVRIVPVTPTSQCRVGLRVPPLLRSQLR